MLYRNHATCASVVQFVGDGGHICCATRIVSEMCCTRWGYHGGRAVPPPFRHGEPALCGSHPL